MRLLKEKLRSLAGWIRRFVADRRGVSSVEYALIVVAVIAIVGAMTAALTDSFDNMFNNMQNQLDNAIT
ncbi:MAG: Flp family type IVb pilin [Gammaproteobacteria bacterium]|nr:Flp family type IVb pilin [Gammaproteobacteria bacterium]